MNAKLIILDEPTTTLSRDEQEKLFALINNLKKKGVAFLYISHDLDDVINISDRISILRDGKLIESLERDEISYNRIIKGMVGREIKEVKNFESHQEEKVVFGLIHGVFVVKTNLNPFIITLATMNIARGASYIITKGATIPFSNEKYLNISNGNLFGIPSYGVGLELDAIVSVVLGGASFTGGKGNALGTIVGSLVVVILLNGLTILGISNYVQMIIQGVIIIIAIYWDSLDL